MLAAMGIGAAWGAPVWPDISAPVDGSAGDGSQDAALVVGIDEYTHVDHVLGADDVAAAWYTWLARARQIPLSRVHRLTNGDATKYAIEEELGEAAADVRSGGTLWVVFVGHGVAMKRMPPEEGEEALLLGVDVSATEAGIRGNGLSRDTLVQRMGASKAARSVLVLDACFSGKGQEGTTLLPGMQVMMMTPPVPASRTVTVLSAAGAAEFAGRLPGASTPAFSYLALGALRGWGDEDHDGNVSASEVVSYATGALVATATNRRQTPGLSGPDIALAHGREIGPDLTARGSPPGDATYPEVQTGVVFPPSDIPINIPTAQTGFLQITVVPPDATIYVDREQFGAAGRAQLERMVGSHEVIAYAPLHHQATRTVALGPDGVRLTIALEPAYGQLRVNSDPAGASVWVDDELVGVTPWEATRKASGSHEVRVGLDGWLGETRTVLVADGAVAEVRSVLTPDFGGLKVVTEPAGAAVFVDGEPAGITPLRIDRKKPGTYTVRVERAGWDAGEAEATVVRGGVAEVRLALTTNTGSLVIRSEPSGAAISLDDIPTGRVTPATFPGLAAGSVKVELTKDGYGAAVRPATVPRGGEGSVDLTLAARIGALSVLAEEVDGSPCEGLVEVDGQRVGSAPIRLDLPATNHEVRVTCRTGTATQRATVVHNERRSIILQVERVKSPTLPVPEGPAPSSPPTLVLRTFNDMERECKGVAFVDGVEVGPTPLTVETAPGVHSVRLQCRNHYAAAAVSARPGQPAQVHWIVDRPLGRADYDPEWGKLLLADISFAGLLYGPAGAALYDGADTGSPGMIAGGVICAVVGTVVVVPLTIHTINKGVRHSRAVQQGSDAPVRSLEVSE